jgi:hypothetical protein
VSDVTESTDLASHTLAWMRRFDTRVDKMTDVLVRHEARLSRIERDLGELKVDFSSMEGRFLGLTNDVIALRESVDALVVRADTHERMIAAVARALDEQSARAGEQTARIDGIDKKVDMILAKLN